MNKTPYPVDKTTLWYKKYNSPNPLFTHAFCNLTRIGLGLSIIAFPEFKKIAVIIIALALIIFFNKFTTNGDNWKPYFRSVLSYLSTLILLLMNEHKIAGSILITDSLLGAQARHLTSIKNCE